MSEMANDKNQSGETGENAFLDDPEALDLMAEAEAEAEAKAEAEEAAAESRAKPAAGRLDGGETPTDAQGLEIELEVAQAEVVELKDRLLRALAETENLRKRSERDRRDAELYGGVRLARDLLSVHDNLGRALESIDEDLRSQAAAVVEGIELTQKELLAVFQKHKIVAVAPEPGDKFDPKQHQAMFEAPVADFPAGSIIQVMTMGFMIGDRLLRPAQVGVSSGAP